MKHCELLAKDLFAYAQKELPPDRIQHLDQHISECVDCRRVLDEFESMLALIEEQKAMEPRPFAETRIVQGIESRIEKRHKPGNFVYGHILRPALIGAGALAAIATGFFIGSGFAVTHTQNNQNEKMIQAVRTELNVPEFMNDDLFHLTE